MLDGSSAGSGILLFKNAVQGCDAGKLQIVTATIERRKWPLQAMGWEYPSTAPFVHSAQEKSLFSSGSAIAVSDGRIQWLNVARAFGIIFVVIGHVYGVNLLEKEAIAWSIFLFHMPLFFILSGYNFRAISTKEIISKRVRSLLVPYVNFFMLILVLSLIKALIMGAPIGPKQILEQVARGIYGGAALGGYFGTFWFITCLFIVSVFFSVLTSFFPDADNWRLMALVALSAILGLLISYMALETSSLSRLLLKLPWNVSAAFVAILFFWYGYFLRTLQADFARIAFFASVVVVISVALGISGIQFAFDMKYLNYGPPILGLILAGALSTLFLVVSQQAAKSDLLCSLFGEFGRASLVIMFMHQFIHFSLREIGVVSSPFIVVAGLVVPVALFRVLKSFRFTKIAFLGNDR